MFWDGLKCEFQASWKAFIARFQRITALKLSDADIAILKHILDSSETGFVTKPKYDEFVRGFGPLKSSVRNIKQIFSQKWWHGYLSSEEAEYFLEGQPPGTFLGRMSVSNPGSFALAVAAERGVKHFLVESVMRHPQLPTGRGVFIPQKPGKDCLAFSNLCQLVNAKEYSGVFIKPFTIDFIQESFFHGVLERDEAEELLADQPPGTFLLRFSSTQKPHLAVSVQGEGGKIAHRLLERKEGRYWNKNKKFRTLKEAVATFPDLRFPAKNTRSDLYSIKAEWGPIADNEPIQPGRSIRPPQETMPVVQTSTVYGDVCDFQDMLAQADDEDDIYGISNAKKKPGAKAQSAGDDIYSMLGGGGGGGGGGGRPMGGSVSVEQVKRIINESNPLLEALGNAKTVRNDNSSRFGKYLEIQFSDNAAPVGGVVTTFLLEKTRVAFQGKAERNFHIFYQLHAGVDASLREELGLGNDPTYFHYLAQSGCTTVEDVDDRADFDVVKNSMTTVGIPGQEQVEIFKILAGILWLGNIRFTGGAPAQVVDKGPLDYAAYLLQVPPDFLHQSLNHRCIQSGSARSTQYQVPQNADQSDAIRDALAKTLYERLFDFVIEKVNASMAFGGNTNVIGVLDIYGFEIFEKNSFEQFCINYVNERLQQIFIELTVRGEQEEYHEEGMKWKDIKFFDNKVVCELIEGGNPPGIFRVLDDVCRSIHAGDQDTTDVKFIEKLNTSLKHEHLTVSPGPIEFEIKHYAGEVTYDARGFPFKNKDTLFTGLVLCMQESASPFLLGLFPEDVSDDKSAPTTAGFKIRQSAGFLVKRLSACTPHYIRCIKPNDRKQPMQFNSGRVEHQVKYLGLLENVKVKRSGYAYRHLKHIFLKRYGIICTKLDTDPQPHSIGEFVGWIKENISDLDPTEFEEGKTKVFVRTPETIFYLEEILLKRTDPEGYKLKVQEYKEREKVARQAQGKNGLKPKCLIQ
eukprot:TRINITY_DN312_c0_g1_i1.p1 TRINITY_DN312_c0_g1~~TRINITY_DN312_c0_g1_i1.p1  ORF type:complete len:968 (+),score=160.10 TRINITY_DN312_c0_g1_i1:957-3860(+)